MSDEFQLLDHLKEAGCTVTAILPGNPALLTPQATELLRDWAMSGKALLASGGGTTEPLTTEALGSLNKGWLLLCNLPTELEWQSHSFAVPSGRTRQVIGTGQSLAEAVRALRDAALASQNVGRPVAGSSTL